MFHSEPVERSGVICRRCAF